MKGFTLVELMIVVVIITILAGIAYPAYIKYTVRTRRAAAATCLMEQAQYMERYYTTHINLGYASAALPATGCMTDLTGHYTIALSGDPTATTYTLAATPQGTQAAKDTECATLSVTQTGAKAASGSYSATPSKCF
jgi:type IV pilus assembly protein PilE